MAVISITNNNTASRRMIMVMVQKVLSNKIKEKATSNEWLYIYYCYSVLCLCGISQAGCCLGMASSAFTTHGPQPFKPISARKNNKAPVNDLCFLGPVIPLMAPAILLTGFSYPVYSILLCKKCRVVKNGRFRLPHSCRTILL